jgi:hypothetical protein
MSKSNRIHLALAVASMVLSAPGHSTAPASATLNRDDLMQLAYPTWRWGPQLFDFPVTQIVRQYASGAGESGTILIDPVNVTRLDESNAVMLATVRPANDKEITCGEICDIEIAAYFFTHSDSGWVLSGRDEHVAHVSYMPTISVEHWPGHGFVAVYHEPITGQGYFSEVAGMLSLQPTRVVPLLETGVKKDSAGVEIHGQRQAGEEVKMTCADILGTSHPLLTELKFHDVDCEQIEAHWRYSGDRIRFEFSGMSRQSDEQGGLQPTKTWRESAVLEWTGSKLKLIEGKLPELGW